MKHRDFLNKIHNWNFDIAAGKAAEGRDLLVSNCRGSGFRYIQASAGIGDALMAPALQHLAAWRGITIAMPVFSIPILFILPVIIWLSQGKKKTEIHLFSQYLSNGIPGSITSLALTVYGIDTMLGAVITGFSGRYFRMKNVLALVYGIRVLIAIVFIVLPKLFHLPLLLRPLWD